MLGGSCCNGPPEQPAGHVMNSLPRYLSVLPVVKWMFQAVGVSRGIRVMVRQDVNAFQELILTGNDAIRANNAPQMLLRPKSVLLVASQILQYARAMLGIMEMASTVLHAEPVIQMLQRSKRVQKEVPLTRLNASAILATMEMDCLAGTTVLINRNSIDVQY
jgi:hypothetical protein